MTIDLIGGTGLFDRLGSLAKTINDLQTNWHDALETRLEDLMAETTTTQQRESAALMGMLRELQLNGKPTFDAIFSTARAILIQMADDDAPLKELTIEAALAELLEQMESNNKGLAHTEPGSSIANGGANTGSGRPVIGLQDRFGEPLKHVYGEVLRFRCVEDGQEGSRRNAGNEAFEIRGELRRQRGDPEWPGGSDDPTAPRIQIKVARAADDSKPGPNQNILANSDWEQDSSTAGLPKNWVTVTGTPTTHFDTDDNDQMLGNTCLSWIGDGSTLAEIKQSFGESSGTPRTLKPLTPYICGSWWKRDGTAAGAGSMRIRIQSDADAVISVNPEDGSAINAERTIDLTALNASYGFFSFVFITPPVIPASMHIALELTTALTSGRSVFTDELIVQEATQLYPGGPFAAMFRGPVDFVVDDFFDDTITQNDTSSVMTFACNRLLGLQELGMTIPTLDAPTVSNALIA